MRTLHSFATLAAVVLLATACGTSSGANSAQSPATPSATTPTASPSADMAQAFRDWADDGGSATLQTIADDLHQVDKDSHPVDLQGLAESCANLTADVETAQQSDPAPDEKSASELKLALDHLQKSAAACTLGANASDQTEFDTMAGEMAIGTKHLQTASERLGEILP